MAGIFGSSGRHRDPLGVIAALVGIGGAACSALLWVYQISPDRAVVVIGGCHTGLACATYLAKAGRDVLGLERRAIVGGAAVTEESWPGYRVSTASYVVSLMPERIVSELDLKRFGYEVSIV